MGKDSSKYNSVYLLLILVVCFFAFFVNNQMIPADLMESRNLATAQEMVREGNFLTPTMNGELRLEKPPLPTWIAAGIEIITPGSLVAQRYAAGLFATILVFFLYFFTSRLTQNRLVGLVASLVLATCFNPIIMGRTATWDIYCHSFMLGAIYFLYIALEKPGAQWKNLLFSGALMGLSFLSKGPISFYSLLLPFLVCYLIVYKPSVNGKKQSLAGMIVLCLIISLWWMGYTLFFNSEAAFHVAQKETSSWLGHNVRPWYYYWQFPVESGIWTLFLVTAIAHYFLYKKDAFRQEHRFVIIWLFVSLLLLSVIPEKKTRYLLPLLVPGAILVAFYIYHSAKSMARKGERVLFRLNALIVAVIMIALPGVFYALFYAKGLISPALLGVTAVLSWSLSGYLLWSVLSPGKIRVNHAFAAIPLFMIVIESICLIPIGRMFINEDRHSIRMLRANEQVSGLPFYHEAGEDIRMELVYESNRTIRPLDLTDTTFIYSHTPFVFVTSHSADSIFKDMKVTVEFIDIFDNNWRKETHKRYNYNLVKEVTIIRSKNE